MVPCAQAYLPFVGCAFTEKKTKTLLLPEAMAPGTQLVFLYFYYTTPMSAVTASELAMHLNLSKATLTRAIAALKQLGLISIKEEGTKKFLTPAIASKHELLDAAKPYLQSPVHQTIYVSEQPKRALLGGCTVEIWKYDPALFASGRIVDSISLIASFTQELDERTEQALESVKESVSW